MRYLRISIWMFLLAGLANASFAQKAEEIVTESSQPAEDIYIDGIIKPEDEQANYMLLPYSHIRAADVPWQKTIYRELDTREKINLGFRHPEEPFFSILRDLGMNGDIVTFQDDGGFPDFKSPLSIEEFEKKIFRIDTSTVTDYETYEEKISINKSEVFYEDINKYRIKEIWYFDEEASRVKNRILGIAPIIDRIDPETGVFKYTETLFWIYFPTAREELVNYKVFNPYNETAPLTWTDVIENRYFSSYIYKTPNELNNRVQDYFKTDDPVQDGIDMLLESEKIKRELFNFEHDLWEY